MRRTSLSERALVLLGHDCEARFELAHRCYVASVAPTRCDDLRDAMVALAREASLAPEKGTRIGAMCASVCRQHDEGATWPSAGRDLVSLCRNC